MGLFSKTTKPNPKLSTQGIEVEFHLQGWWEFAYRRTVFQSFDHSLTLPSITDLDQIVDTVESLKPEMKSRLEKGWAEWPGAKVDDGETYTVDVNKFAEKKSFAVSWSEGASWGDMGIDFTIKDHAIVNESWGD